MIKHLHHNPQEFLQQFAKHAFLLYYNGSVNRRLSSDMILKMLTKLPSSGYAQQLDKKAYKWMVYWPILGERESVHSQQKIACSMSIESTVFVCELNSDGSKLNAASQDIIIQ